MFDVCIFYHWSPDTTSGCCATPHPHLLNTWLIWAVNMAARMGNKIPVVDVLTYLAIISCADNNNKHFTMHHILYEENLN